MEGENNNNAAAQEALPVSETVKVAVGAEGNGGDPELSRKRKRGRPSKLPTAAESSASPQKRGRGRPRGSSSRQTLSASSGGTDVEYSSGSNFTPHVITVQTGEDIVQRISSFSQNASDSICILSARGTVSTVEIRQAGSSDNIIKYNGHFGIVSVNGSRIDNGQNCVISVQLTHPDCRLFGGIIGGSLIAAGPTELVIATFKANHSIEPSNAGVSGVPPVPAVPAQMGGADVINQASSQPFDWNSLHTLL